MLQKPGRPASEPGTKRIQIAAKVAPETHDYLASEQARSGKSLGRILDEAAKFHAKKSPADRG
jgi:hypothetical protein